MTPAPEREEALFQAATQLPGSERSAFLDQQCHSDPALRERLEALLAAYDLRDGFMTDPTQNFPAEPNQGSSQAPDPAVGLTIGRYKLLEKIGEGGCGIVYVAEQTEPIRRRVALKVIKLGMDTRQVVARFEAERQALAMMDHPNIAKILDAGVVGSNREKSEASHSDVLTSDLRPLSSGSGRPYFVMELVRGIRITEYSDQHRLSTQERLDLFIRVCQAIQHAHQKGIIHRDIKPSNILVTLHDGVPVPKVIDFGIAKATEGRLTDATVYTQLHQFIGTPAYMSPEQAEMSGLDVDTRSDIYSLGVLLYELLTGKTPLDGQELIASGLDAMRRTIREKEPLRPSTRSATMSGEELTTTAKRRGAEAPKLMHLLRGDLDWIVMKCLEKDRSRRYETANGLAMDLKRHLNSEPVVARPPSAVYRFQKAFRCNKLAFTSGTMMAMVLIVGAIVSSWQANVAKKATRVAENARAAEAVQRLSAQTALGQAEAERARASAREKGEKTFRYIANMNLIQQAWRQNDVARVRQLVEETAAYSERGFEWYYWQRQTHLEIRTLYGHTESVWSAAFSRDGQRIVTASGGTEGRIYRFNHVPDHTARIWDVSTGKEVSILQGHQAAVLAAAFSPDGQLILTVSGDRTARLWDSVTGLEIRPFHGHKAGVICGAFSPDGRRIVTGGFDSSAIVWETETGRELVTFHGHTEPIITAEFSGDGRRIVTGGADSTARVWDANTGEELLALKHKHWVWAAAFSPDGKWIVSGGDDEATVWDALSGSKLLEFHSTAVGKSGAAFSPDGRRIATAAKDCMVKVWDAANGDELLTLKGHTKGVNSVAFSPDGRQVLTASDDRTAKLWDAVPHERPLSSSPDPLPAQCMGFSTDGRRMIIGDSTDFARIRDVATGKELLGLTGHTGQVKAAAFSADDEFVITGSADQTARVWLASTGAERMALRGHSGWVRAVSFSQDAQRLATGSVDQTARIWDAESGKELLRLKGHRGPILAAAFSQDRRWLVTGSGDHTAKVWDAVTGKERFPLKGHTRPVQAVAFSPNAEWIATASLDGTAKVWDSATGQERHTLSGPGNELLSVTFFQDDRRILTGSADRTVRLWEMSTGKELARLDGLGSPVLAVALLSGGQRILAGGTSEETQIWEAATPQQVATWRHIEEEYPARWSALKAETVAKAEHERLGRTRDPGAIRTWLLLAPIRLQATKFSELGKVLDQEQVPGEASLRPRAGERVKLSDGERLWSRVDLEDYVIDLEQLLGECIEYAAAYAVCYIQSQTDQSGLEMKVGSDDSAKVFLNGRQIYRFGFGGFFNPERDTVKGIELKRGLNVLVFKIVNFTMDWRGSLRLTDSHGQPVRGISVTLDPDAP